jgi:hypothetical protein
MLDTDTFVITVYCLVDDLYRAHLAPLRRHQPGCPPQVSDSEVLTLLLLAHWYRWSERQLLRHAQTVWSHLFPRLLSQSAFNRRVRHCSTALAWLVPEVAAALDAPTAAYEVIDGTAVPLAQRGRGTASRLFGLAADLGRGGTEKDWYYGCKLLLSVTPSGAITGFVAGPASTEERWLAEALLAGRRQPLDGPWIGYPPSLLRRATGLPYTGPNGPLWPRLGCGRPAVQGRYLGDRGYIGPAWRAHWEADWGSELWTRVDYAPDAWRSRRAHASLRQIVETVNGLLKAGVGLAFPGAKTLWGLKARLAAKLLAFNLGLLINQRLRRPLLTILTLAA